MALSLAIPLSDVNVEDFRRSTHNLNLGRVDILPSPASSTSGYVSLPSPKETDSESSRSDSPEDGSLIQKLRSSVSSEIKQIDDLFNDLVGQPPSVLQVAVSCASNTVKQSTTKVMYEGRDILNLGANVREPSWQMRAPVLPLNDVFYYIANRSVYDRLGYRGLTKEYPMVICRLCEFRQVHPLLRE